MTIIALKKTVTTPHGGLYTDAIHKTVSGKLVVSGTETFLNVRLAMFKDLVTAQTPGAESAFDKNFAVDVTDVAVSSALAALYDAIYAQIKAADAGLTDAEDITN